MDSAIEQINEHIKDKRYFTARWLSHLSAQSGLEPHLIAQCLCVLTSVYLCIGSQSNLLANIVLIGYPLLIQYVYVEEKPSRDYLLIYWGCWGILTTFDRILEQIPSYYVVKICLLMMLFLDPWCYCIPIKQLLKGRKIVSEKEHGMQSKPNSPPPEKPECEKKKTAVNKEGTVATTGGPPSRNNMQKKMNTVKPFSPVDKTQVQTDPKEVSVKTAISLLEKTQTDPQENSAHTPLLIQKTQTDPRESSSRTAFSIMERTQTDRESSIRTSMTQNSATPRRTHSDYMGLEMSYKPMEPVTSTVDVVGRKRTKANDNPMTSNMSYRLAPTPEGISNREISFATNIHDLLFHPTEKLVFNSPFDFDNITYHMQIRNNSHHRIAFAIKGNCIPRILAYPPSGIIKPKQEMTIAVTMAKFDPSVLDVSRDRIVYEYILMKKSQDEIKEFSHMLLEEAEMKRRKNIRIEYNS